MIKERFCNIAILISSLIILLLVGEISIRTYHFFEYTIRGNTVKRRYVDDKLGWRVTENYRFHGFRTDASGKKYPVENYTNKYGFQLFGDINSDKRKIMIIGDSFTEASHVSNYKSYYGVLSNSLPLEVFAYGAGGYGTLQEYMILDEYVDLINPDAIVLQYCSNDFINNSYELEYQSHINNNRMRRPYLNKNGQVVYALPKRLAFIRHMSNKYSSFLFFLIDRLDGIYYNYTREQSIERYVVNEGKSHPGLKQAAQTTREVIKMVRSRVPPNATVYAFSVDDDSPYYEELKRISKQSGIEFIDGIPQAVREADERGLVTRAADKAHWNELGHKIAGEALVRYFKTEWTDDGKKEKT